MVQSPSTPSLHAFPTFYGRLALEVAIAWRKLKRSASMPYQPRCAWLAQVHRVSLRSQSVSDHSQNHLAIKTLDLLYQKYCIDHIKIFHLEGQLSYELAQFFRGSPAIDAWKTPIETWVCVEMNYRKKRAFAKLFGVVYAERDDLGCFLNFVGWIWVSWGYHLFQKWP